MTIAVFTVAALLACGLVAWAGHRLLFSDGPRTSGMADGLGNFIDVFDPARARADEDLKSHKNMGAIIPSPDDDHPRWTVDLARGTVRIPRAR